MCFLIKILQNIWDISFVVSTFCIKWINSKSSTYFQRHYASRLSLEDIQTLQSTGIILGISGGCEHLSLRRRSKDSAAGLRFSLPRGTEALSLYRGIGAEFYNHEVWGRDEEFVAEILLAGKGREIYRFLLGSTTYENLHYIETLLGLEFLKLEHESWFILNFIPIISTCDCYNILYM